MSATTASPSQLNAIAVSFTLTAAAEPNACSKRRSLTNPYSTFSRTHSVLVSTVPHAPSIDQKYLPSCIGLNPIMPRVISNRKPL